jgi:hypothetical protein
VDAVSGGAGDDTISGIVGQTGATLSIGDNIMGGAGTDTLNLISVTSTAAPLVSINGVETINVRILGTAAEAQVMNANDWSGVSVLTNASSLTSTTLQVSGLETTTNVKVFGDSDVNVAFRNTTTASSVSTTLVSVGTGNTATTIGSASAAATANIDLDLNNSGLLAAVAIDVQGSVNLARLEGGSNVKTYTITGTGNAALITDDAITSFDASAAAGNIDITFEANSTVAAKGGAGNDTFRFGTTISDNDTVDGGVGTDSISLSIGDFATTLKTTSVESATVTFGVADPGDLNMASAAISTLTVRASGADFNASISSIVDGATVNLQDNNLGQVTLDYASGSTTTTINVGTATAGVALSGISVTDVATVSIGAVSGSAGTTVALGTATFGATTKSVTVTNVGDADLTVADLHANGATAFSIVNSGSGDITLTSGMEAGTAVATISIVANGGTGGDVTVGAVGAASATAAGFTTLTLDGTNGSDITVGAVAIGDAVTGTSTRTIVLSGAGNSIVGTTALDITMTGDDALIIDINAGATGTVTVGDVVLTSGAQTGASLTFEAMTIGSGATVTVDYIEAQVSGTQITVGAATLEKDATLVFGKSGIMATAAADVDISNLTFTLGASSNLVFGSGSGIEIDNSATGGVIGSITLDVADDASADFDTIAASGIGALDLTVRGDGGIDFGNMTVSNTVGAIQINGDASADVTFGTIGASAVGAIRVSGELDVTIGAITTTAGVGNIDTTNQSSGAFTINLSGVTNAVRLDLGKGTNTVISGLGNDVITLTSGQTAAAGNDIITFNATAQGTDSINNFIAGAAASGGDQIRFGTGINLLDGSGDPFAGGEMATAVSFATIGVSAASAATAMEAGDNIVVITGTAFASWSGVIDYIGNGKSGAVSFVAASAAGNLAVVWANDAGNTVVSLATVTAGVTVLTTGISAYNMAIIAGVTPGALVAANFDIAG